MVASVSGSPLHHVVPDDDQRDTGRAEVLLRARVDQGVARDVDGLAEHVRRGVADQRRVTEARLVLELDAVDRLVRGHVHVGRARRQPRVAGLRDAGEVLGLVGERHAGGANPLGFLQGLLAPRPRDDVVGRRARGQQVHRHHRELGAGTALQEQHVVVGGDAGQLPKRGVGVADHLLEGLRAVADLQDGHADPGSASRSRCASSSTDRGSTAGPAAKLKMRLAAMVMIPDSFERQLARGLRPAGPSRPPSPARPVPSRSCW